MTRTGEFHLAWVGALRPDGLRIAAGHAEGTLPAAPEQMRVLTELVHRWTPERLHDRSLDAKLAQIRERTREFFDRVFS